GTGVSDGDGTPGVAVRGIFNGKGEGNGGSDGRGAGEGNGASVGIGAGVPIGAMLGCGPGVGSTCCCAETEEEHRANARSASPGNAAGKLNLGWDM
ncbi:MAG: hypothetical protein WCS31_10495, partial [Verrucomicrobiae bacterium]